MQVINTVMLIHQTMGILLGDSGENTTNLHRYSENLSVNSPPFHQAVGGGGGKKMTGA